MKLRVGLLFIAFTGLLFGQQTKEVLFLGNSFTSANNLPALVRNLAEADGNTLTVDSNVPGGYQLMQHAADNTTLNKIMVKDWDFVVIQAQSQEPSFPDPYVEDNVYPYAEVLVNKIIENNACTIPLFYATWGRQTGDPQWEGINTFGKMNERLYSAYSYMAEKAQGMLVPAGVAFAGVKDGTLGTAVTFEDLYTADGSHPTIKGSYLVACLFNNIIFNKTSLGNTYLPNGISAEEGNYLQEVADYVTYGIDSIRLDYRTLSENTFSAEVDGMDVSFTASVTGGDFVAWDFGDGEISNEENIVHTYTSNGTFEVGMITTGPCYSDTVKMEVTVSTLGLNSENARFLKVYPNPSSDGNIHISYEGEEPYSIFSILGTEVYSGNDKQIFLDKGVYFLHTTSNITRKIIVQ